MNIATFNPRKQVTIIGGGSVGCLTAIMLARRGFIVTLIEAQPHLLSGASLIASRLHLGGEYPSDPQTMRDCIKAACIWALSMPEHIYTPAAPMRFLITPETAEEGELTPGKYASVYHENVVKPYTDILRSFTAYIKETRADVRTWTNKQMADLLFGLPENLYKPINAQEFKEFTDAEENCSVAGGFQSKERGLNIPKYLIAIEDELARLQHEGKVHILTGYRVNKDGIAQQKDGRFTLSSTHITSGKPATFENVPLVVKALAERGPELSALGPNESVTVYHRAMLLMDTSKCHKKVKATFKMKGESGGMISPYNDWTTVGYVPSAKCGYRGGETKLTQQSPSIPAEWSQEPTTPEQKHERDAWMGEYFDELKKRFPSLEGAKPIRLIIRNTMNFQESLEQRRHETTKEIMPGIVNATPTKLTFAVQSAMEAAHLVEQRYLEPKAPLLKRSDAFDLALSGKYNLQNMILPGNPERYKEFSKCHPELPPDMRYQPDLTVSAEPPPSRRVVEAPLDGEPNFAARLATTDKRRSPGGLQ